LARQRFVCDDSLLLCFLDSLEAAGREAAHRPWLIDIHRSIRPRAGGPRGYDAPKRSRAASVHIVTDTVGLLVGAGCTPPMSRIAMVPGLSSATTSCFLAAHLVADSVYNAPTLLDTPCKIRQLDIEIGQAPPLTRPASNSSSAMGFVERTPLVAQSKLAGFWAKDFRSTIPVPKRGSTSLPCISCSEIILPRTLKRLRFGHLDGSVIRKPTERTPLHRGCAVYEISGPRICRTADADGRNG